MRVVRDVVGTPIKASDLEIGDLVNAEPAALFDDRRGRRAARSRASTLQIAKAKAAVILVRMEPDDITPGQGRENWARRRHPLLLQDLHPRRLPDLPVRADHPPPAVPLPPVDLRPRRHGKVIFGPAARALPQLPLAVDDEGYLVAQSDFTEPVGPSFWERDSQ